jgi:erythromycin esterase
MLRIDPEAPLDDLEPFAERFRAARVVAIGESAHLVREYYQVRHRLTRFLVERCGFTAFAMESGFSEGLAVDAWIRGGDGELREIADGSITYTMGRCAEMRAQLAWQRARKVPFFGLDVPGGTASPLPALTSVRRFLADIDPDAVPLVDRLTGLAGRYAGEHSLPAYTAYAQLDRADRDAMTALLAELAARFDALEPQYPEASVVRHELRLACLLDQALRGYAARQDGAHPKVAARDRGLAETVFWVLDRLGPDAKLVVGAHNSHIQRTPVRTPAFALSAMGHHLAHRLGRDYLAVAVTTTAGRTSTHRVDPAAPGGVTIAAADLAAPVPGSIEAAFGATPAMLDLHRAGEAITADRIRLMDTYQEAPIADAYDLVLCLPATTTAEQVVD